MRIGFQPLTCLYYTPADFFSYTPDIQYVQKTGFSSLQIQGCKENRVLTIFL
jgi:hypothetical protein